MGFRPQQARWFETYTPRDQTVRAVEVLARTGSVQLELDPRDANALSSQKLRFFINHFQQLAQDHAESLPDAEKQATTLMGDPVHIANQALHQLRIWSAQLDFLNEQLAELRAEHDELVLLAECVEGMREAGLDYAGIFKHTRFLCKCLFACPHGRSQEALEYPVVEALTQGPHHDFLYVAAAPEQREAILQLVIERGCQQFGIPAWLSNDQGLQQKQVIEQLDKVFHEIQKLSAQITSLKRDPNMAAARANIETLNWYLEHAVPSLNNHKLCHITGWCTMGNPSQLQDALDNAGITAYIRFPNAPDPEAAPVDLLDRWWTRPFRPFIKLWGIPGRMEVDPSGLLPFLVPLMFGYMFPDVGHGLLLAVGSALASRRWPQVRFLIPCGLSAMVFGLIFGDIFGFENLIPALWLKPLQDPIPVLVVPLLFGILLMLLGLLFSGIEAKWRGEMAQWLRLDAAVLVLYASLLAGSVYPQALWLSGIAVFHYAWGALTLDRHINLGSVAVRLGELFLSVFQLIMNTLSFLRIGAFALAHAALSQATQSIADSVEQPIAWVVIILLGNVFILILEGLLVFVQTTRLVLFEFFIRFLHAEGRLFNSLRPPSSRHE